MILVHNYVCIALVTPTYSPTQSLTQSRTYPEAHGTIRSTTQIDIVTSQTNSGSRECVRLTESLQTQLGVLESRSAREVSAWRSFVNVGLTRVCERASVSSITSTTCMFRGRKNSASCGIFSSVKLVYYFHDILMQSTWPFDSEESFFAQENRNTALPWQRNNLNNYKNLRSTCAVTWSRGCWFQKSD